MFNIGIILCGSIRRGSSVYQITRTLAVVAIYSECLLLDHIGSLVVTCAVRLTECSTATT